MAEVFHGGKGHVFDREDLERLYKMTKHQLKQYEAAFLVLLEVLVLQVVAFQLELTP